MLSKKEIAIVAFLALLATGLSIFIEHGCPSTKSSEGPYFMLPFCLATNGFPLSYWNSAGKAFMDDAIIFIIVDFVFYFVIFYLIGLLLKLILKRRKNGK